MYRNNIDMRLLINGRPVREYSHQGMVFVESRHGSNYTIKIKNDNSFRVMAVVSVDGLDVITGKAAEKSDKGYIVDAYSATEIRGYRLSDDKSVDFVFVSKDGKKNYASVAEDGDKRNSGVIGIRVFQEKTENIKVIENVKEIHHYHDNPVYPWNPYHPHGPSPIWYTTSESENKERCGMSDITLDIFHCKSIGEESGQMISTTELASNKNNFDTPIKYDHFDTGTGWGKVKEDKVKKGVFRKGKMVGELVLYYATREALLNMGIDLTELPKIAQMPKAFKDSEYCQPPKGWRG